jgi:hypothetical protein
MYAPGASRPGEPAGGVWVKEFSVLGPRSGEKFCSGSRVEVAIPRLGIEG